MSTKRREGTASVELVLVFTISVFLLFAIIECGMLVNAKILVTTAAREGARRAAVDGGASQAAYSRIREILESGGLWNDSTQAQVEPHTASFGATVTVRVEHMYQVRSAPLAVVIGSRIPVSAVVVSRSERVR